MSEEARIETRIMNHMEGLIAFIKDNADNVSDQAISLFHEIVYFGIAENLVNIVACATVVWAIFRIRALCIDITPDCDKQEVRGWSVFFIILGAIAPFFTCITAFTNMAKAILAPRLFVMEFISRLVG